MMETEVPHRAAIELKVSPVSTIYTPPQTPPAWMLLGAAMEEIKIRKKTKDRAKALWVMVCLLAMKTQKLT
jgi:hypothetical protein